MKVKVLREAGYEEAMLGLSLNKLRPVETMPALAIRMSGKDQGHDKFLRMIDIWIDITASRFFWHEMDTYKIGRNHLPDDDEGDLIIQSASTMNNIKDVDLIQEHFEHPINSNYLVVLNENLKALRCGKYPLDRMKNDLPEGYLQRRILKFNYKVAYDILETRGTHRLPQWHQFCDALRTLEHQELFTIK